ncbi:MAG: DnaJ domain-containing protein [Sulfuricellaceae bacterium]|nr:DnaJ domain-containing protein [Sulfuricellaceae bacterium]
MKKTLYDWLEVSPGASQEAISASFQRLSEKMNPDREENHFVPNAQSNFILLKEAYATLSDPLLRRAYDDK